MRVTIPYLYPLMVIKQRARVAKQIFVRDSFETEIPTVREVDAPIVLKGQSLRYGSIQPFERRLHDGNLICPAVINGEGTGLKTVSLPGLIAEYDAMADLEYSLGALNNTILDASRSRHYRLRAAKVAEVARDLPLDVDLILENGHETALERTREATRALVSIDGLLYRNALQPASKIEVGQSYIRRQSRSAEALAEELRRQGEADLHRSAL